MYLFNPPKEKGTVCAMHLTFLNTQLISKQQNKTNTLIDHEQLKG